MNKCWSINKRFIQISTYIRNIDSKHIYLTFDDGPHPSITPWVMDQLAFHGAKATFFCVGQNINKYPDTFQEIKNRGHQVGNHTYNHLKGWFTKNKDYYSNISECQNLMPGNKLFRPPYGRIKPTQYFHLRKSFRIIMWNQLSWDFLKNLDREKALLGLKKRARQKSIIVFHDSVKAQKNLEYLLPRYLEYLSEEELISRGL